MRNNSPKRDEHAPRGPDAPTAPGQQGSVLPGLPAPERGVRARVRRHLDLLLAATAIGSAGACDHTVVCDPLPAPIDCSVPTALSVVTASAGWVESGGALVATVSVQSSSSDVTFTTAAVVSSATQVGEPTVSGATITLELAPEPSATSVTVDVLTCPSSAVVLRLTLDVSQPAAGASIPVTIAVR